MARLREIKALPSTEGPRGKLDKGDEGAKESIGNKRTRRNGKPEERRQRLVAAKYARSIRIVLSPTDDASQTAALSHRNDENE